MPSSQNPSPTPSDVICRGSAIRCISQFYVEGTFAMMAFSLCRLMYYTLVNEETSFELEHLGADVADEPEVVMNATQV